MQWLLVAIVGIVEKVISWFVIKGFKVVAVFLAYVTTTISLFIGFLALVFTTLNLLIPFAPHGLGFGLSMLPPVTGVYISTYMTVLITKRVFDYHKHFTRDFTQSLMKI